MIQTVGFKQQLERVLRTSKGERVLDEAQRLARDPVAKARIEELRRELTASAPPPDRATRPRD